MRNEVPAAIPLIAFVTGLALGPVLVNPWLAALALLAGCAVARFRGFAVFAALGIVIALQSQSIRERERDAFASFHPDRFVILEAPIERDWASHRDSWILRASRFTANGVSFDQPISIYARFEPHEIAMEARVRVEAFLRVNDRGHYTASVKSSELMALDGRLPRWHPAAWNRALANRIEPYAATRPVEVALAHALVLGRGERLDQTMRDNFRRGGTYHLLVFSGLQITFAAAMLAALLRWLHRPRASDWLLLAFSVVAPLFIGPTSSVSRASVGIGLYALSRIARRPTSLENLWCVAALARLIFEPRDLTDASFHLTYAGAGALLFIGKQFGRPRRVLATIGGAEVAITPLTLHHFHQYALGGSLLTVAMSPLIFAMLALCALAFAIPCEPLFAAIGLLHRGCEALNTLGVSGFFTAPPLASTITGFGGAMLAIAFLRSRARVIAIVLALLVPTTAAIVRFLALREVDHPRVTFLDVGQGDAIAVRSDARTILVDGGPDQRIVPLLLDRGIRRLDAVVLTHAHPDHCEGLVAVLRHLDVSEVWLSPRRFRGDCATRLLEAARVPIHLIRDGDALTLDEIRITALTAPHTFRRAPDNNASVVLRAGIGTRRVLLTGDIEREAELHFADRDLRADVLKVAHHGSRSSTSEAFLDAVRPRIAVVSCGRRNLFGHPHPTVLEALASRGIRTRRTDRDGSIDVEVRDGKLYVTSRTD